MKIIEKVDTYVRLRCANRTYRADQQNEKIKIMCTDLKMILIKKLEQLKVNNQHGFIVGVEVSKPKPWTPAAEMIQLHETGLDIKTIAVKTGYSMPTVERSIKTRGEDPRTGPQCDNHIGKVFSIDEALKEMPLPCGPNCICSWRPIFRSDRIK